MNTTKKKCKDCGNKHYARGFCRTCYQKYMRLTSPEFKENQDRATWKSKTCKILKKHHEDMKGDPDHLTTEFMQRIIGIKCKVEEE